MHAHRLLSKLANLEDAREWLVGLGVRDAKRGVDDLLDLVGRCGSDSNDVVVRILEQLEVLLPRCSDPGMALTNLDRYVAALATPRGGLARLAVRPRATETLLQVFSTSQHLSEVLIRSPELIDWLQSGAERRDRQTLIDDLWNILTRSEPADDHRLALRRFRLRETLRIGYNDIVRGFPLEVTTVDLSNLADACVEAATRLARASVESRYGTPMRADGEPARFVVLGLGKLGGTELNYSSDIDLIFMYDEDGMTRGPRVVSSSEFFARMGGEVVRLLADHTQLGMAYRVDMRLRPEGDQGVLVRSFDATMGYYVTRGRTWERQALIKCRPVAGDLDLGRGFIEAITPFIYRRYLSASEIAEIKALKRRIEQRTASAGRAEVEVKTGRGGIRDVEFVVQFLQLLHGGEYPEVRGPNTLEAIDRLEQLGSLTAEERAVMDGTYRFLRQVEHRLQILFDRQTHEMPRDIEDLRTLAIRMGYAAQGALDERSGPAHRFLADYKSKTELNRRILDHILHDAFLDDAGAEADPVVDLVLDPDPSDELVAEVLGRYPFRDRAGAYQNLMALAREDFPFLSHARCRHFLASIAPRLMQALGQTADPDLTLANLEKVSASLGAKAILWELFNFNPPSLRLYVDLCATSQLVSRLLITNPGMIDDLMDSLVIDRPLPGAAIKAELAELTKGAEDLAPILWSFRNKEWVRIGTRDVLGREPIREVTRELADVAEAVVGQIARNQWTQRAKRFGVPTRATDGARDRWAILALGRLGGRELNYHSDLDLVFLHESDGQTMRGVDTTSNQQFVTEVAQRMLKALGRDALTGTLYQVDTRLRPHGAAGPLVNTLESFTHYYETAAQSWERLALTRGRVIFATGGFGREVGEALRAILTAPVDPATIGPEVAAMRRRLEDSRSRNDLKRGIGGLADVEFIVQYLMLVNAAQRPDVLRTNLWDGLDALLKAGVLPAEMHAELRDIYNFLRSVEARLRLVHDRAGTELPEDPDDLTRLARRLNYDAADPTLAVSTFLLDSARFTTRARAIFQQIILSEDKPEA
ncbi:MAG: bifunctional [glutamate--ammonia ligase]-adenylyl-L-tyrosine phosphorylase/[glutamate--ammonia-ligase] adenylyltransferase [Paludisphaera borealis]|uniref:bifunctional [glutamate--ammonia ligase]-adenylyl-L-tyrosine phosphorylase/[glutamate--ammonia-ligase] adenylyltransferase n=1 Tax=Paludisphaera borealis TaxID=1387353 RepID=UPI00283D6B37|nr:bifunctional [glutamate--ammonia ligase]-adenylyl-L-tyrosine phosphorylase/[glutamate--ammonia-ligase] adenylyltransferase [Paludisphaera borealis]MDR3618185.1 bifunctional [glutamate--ammonia ligase]-adenylyl-L-tyrosine phosphorylase/[glutamate--ammonia-ligase] adenylyltransferase [Paludisphaera borealis]